MLGLYYPGTQVRVVFGHTGRPAPRGAGARFMQYLDARLYDVTKYFQGRDRFEIFLLPTLEKTIPPRLLSKPEGGEALRQEYATLRFADQGARLAQDYYRDDGLWIIQYLNGHFYDVTDYYKVRRRAPGLRLLQDLDSVKAGVSRTEFYPDYLNFGTPNGRPVFFATPERDIVTQIGGSSVILPPFHVPARAVLHFDVSWMFDSGDGGWGELQLVCRGISTTVFREYFRPNPRGSGLQWKEVRIDLSRYAGESASLVLRCYNDRGRNTVSDWLNWRDVSIESPDQKLPAQASSPGRRPRVQRAA